MKNVEKLGPNLFRIERKHCRRPDGKGGFRMDHGPILVDTDLATAECGTCGEKLNPMSLLKMYAQHESRLAMRFDELRLHIEKLKFQSERQNRVRCEHCGKLTRIKKGASS